MQVAVVRREVPGFALVEIRFSEGHELGLGPSFGGVSADVYAVVAHAVEEGVGVGIGSGPVPVVDQGIDLSLGGVGGLYPGGSGLGVGGYGGQAE